MSGMSFRVPLDQSGQQDVCPVLAARQSAVAIPQMEISASIGYFIRLRIKKNRHPGKGMAAEKHQKMAWGRLGGNNILFDRQNGTDHVQGIGERGKLAQSVVTHGVHDNPAVAAGINLVGRV